MTGRQEHPAKGKVSKESVNYRDGEGGSIKRCVTCAMFDAPVNCVHVKGRIGPMKTCDDWDFYQRKSTRE